MKNKIFSIFTIIAGLFFWTVPALSNNTITISDGQGDPGDEISLTIGLNSTEPISALQISSELGEGVEAVAGSATSSGRASGHTASCGTKDGVTSFLLFSTSMAQIEAGSGIIGEFKIKLGPKPLRINPELRVKATNADGEEILCSASGMGIIINGATAEYPQGNVYDFGNVPLRQSYTKNIPVRNAGTSLLEITSAEFSSDDFTIQTQFPLYIQGGMTSNITIGYSPSKRGNVSETMNIISNSSNPDNTLRLLASPYAVNEIIVEDTSGNSDTEIEVPVSMKNMDPVTGFTLEFQLPSHLKYVDGSFRLSDRKVDHQLTASFKDNKLSATAYSLNDLPFSGNEGVLAYFKVVPEGRTSVSLAPSKAVLAAIVDDEIMNVTSATYPGRITISYPSISTSSSVSMGRVPITEPSTVTLSIRNTGSAVLTIDKLVCDNPDFEFDSSFPVDIQPGSYFYLTVTDASTKAESFKSLVQLYSNDPDQRLFTVTVSGERYTPNSLGLNTTPVLSNAGEVEIEVLLDNYDLISGLQFDMTVPDGFSPEEGIPLDRADGFTINFSKIGSSTVRYLCYSLGGKTIESGKGAVISLPFSFGEDIGAGSYKFSLSNIKLSNSAGINCSSDISNPTAYLQIGQYIPVEKISIVNAPSYLEFPGSGVRLAASLEPYDASIKDVAWSSSDDAVATVSQEGEIEVRGLGEVNITATALGGENVSTTVTIPILGKEFSITYFVDGEEYETHTIRYGSAITPIEEPAKEGYTFSGWTDLPESMPAENISVHGTFAVNTYTFTFYLDDKELEKREFEYGSISTAPEVEEKEGYTFSGWTDLPETVPAHDVDVHGQYNVNSYNLIFYIDEEVFSQALVNYGTPIVCPEVREKEGHTFSGWGDVPATMPAHDLQIKGTYNVNKYSISFYVDGTFLEKREYDFGSKVTAPEVEEREDYAFSGWIDLPETMPAKDLDIHGTYISTVERFLLSFYVEGVFHSSQELKFGAKINPPVMEERPGYVFTWDNLPETMPGNPVRVDGYYISLDDRFNLSYFTDDILYKSYSLGFNEKTIIPEYPEKEGYTFSGWSEIPEFMPHYDVDVKGTFIINYYKISFYIDGKLIESRTLEYGAEIIAPTVAEKEGYTFSGWDNLPARMPASDVEVTGKYIGKKYTLSFFLDGTLLESREVEVGSTIVAPDVPKKEGYTFSGWINLPKTMPAYNVEVNGKFNINSYKISFYIDGKLIESRTLEYGAEIMAPTVTDKEGYTFSGWDSLPKTMPAKDLTVNGKYNANSYEISFYLDGEIFLRKTLTYGSVISAPSVDAKEGYTFSGWMGLPSNMPAKDISIYGTYDVNSYKLSFYIDGLLYESRDVEFGSGITAPAIDPREGYSFSGWVGLPSTMPARDVNVNGSFTINNYKASFYLDGELIETKTFEYGVTIEAPEVPAKTGYTFSGWQNMPETMPSHDLEINGSYVINSYSLNFYIDGQLYDSRSAEYNSEIIAPEAPEKEGHSFNGWDNLPERMPAQDLHIQGSYSVNKYLVTIYIDGEFYDSFYVEYGEKIELPEPEFDETTVFNGWISEIPETMPARDIEIHGTTSKVDAGVEGLIDDENLKIDVFTPSGILLFNNITVEDFLKNVAKGIYIIRNGKSMYKLKL